MSIVIPAHVGAQVTEACLRAIASRTAAPPYEVIVVDDAGDAANRRLWKIVEGARVVVNEQNLGYLRSVNLGASEARGRYIVPLNNDTEVQDGWLQALVERAQSSPDVGVVAPKLLYPDGTLQEAGAIVFQDGSGWNFGRGLDADAGEFNYVRDIDYASGACLLVRADLWSELGGYSERYEPMYYEDADLCFAARERGLRVVYEPAARVVHVEGASAGTDPHSGGKRHQELNRPKFVERWREQLESEQLAGGARERAPRERPQPRPPRARRRSPRADPRSRRGLVADGVHPAPARRHGLPRDVHPRRPRRLRALRPRAAGDRHRGPRGARQPASGDRRDRRRPASGDRQPAAARAAVLRPRARVRRRRHARLRHRRPALRARGAPRGAGGRGRGQVRHATRARAGADARRGRHGHRLRGRARGRLLAPARGARRRRAGRQRRRRERRRPRGARRPAVRRRLRAHAERRRRTDPRARGHAARVARARARRAEDRRLRIRPRRSASSPERAST